MFGISLKKVKKNSCSSSPDGMIVYIFEKHIHSFSFLPEVLIKGCYPKLLTNTFGKRLKCIAFSKAITIFNLAQ